MKIFNKEMEVYTFSELSDIAKLHASEQTFVESGFFQTLLEEWKKDYVDCYFKDGKPPKVQSNFDFCQGDGLNLYGTLSFNDLRRCARLPLISEDFPIVFKPNQRYTYCLWDKTYPEVIEVALWEEKGERYAKNQRKNIVKICDTLAEMCGNMREYGESLLFETFLDPSSYEEEYFDKNGNFACYEYELEKTG